MLIKNYKNNIKTKIIEKIIENACLLAHVFLMHILRFYMKYMHQNSMRL